jgi:hypothetical protein
MGYATRQYEVDKVFWQEGMVATAREQWAATQEKLVAEDARVSVWIVEPRPEPA